MELRAGKRVSQNKPKFLTLENHEKAFALFDKVSIDIKENENLDYKSDFKNIFKGKCFTGIIGIWKNKLFKMKPIAKFV